MNQHGELLIDGTFVGGSCDQAVPKAVLRSPWDGRFVATAAEGGWSELRAALDAAHDAFSTYRDTPRRERQALLRRIATSIREERQDLADLLVAEIGKPVTLALGEVDRMAIVFDQAADLLGTWGLEQLPGDLDPRGDRARLTVERRPLGVVYGFVPYNWPYNLAAHKIAPALAVGCPLVLKCSPLAPTSTLALARLCHRAGVPAGVLNAWNGDDDAAGRALEDERIAVLSFTGSERVGWMLKERTKARKTVLELGGNASAIVAADGDLDRAVARLIPGAFGYAGQVCISVQHIWVHRSVYAAFRERFLAALPPVADPAEPSTICGPMISPEAADKVRGLIHEALEKGAKRTGEDGAGNRLTPTVLEDVPEGAAILTEEAFGPVVTLAPFDDLAEAYARVNASRFGIQAAIFTDSLATAESAYRSLEVGGVIVNDSPSLRLDAMPYGGVRRSGLGREGLRYAMDELTEPKAFLIAG
ncbi:aldehyde dehydrogenase family protein [bacterium]|nr:MAG: aldehyde dehydrogenase family protein [bacterium]